MCNAVQKAVLAYARKLRIVPSAGKELAYTLTDLNGAPFGDFLLSQTYARKELNGVSLGEFLLSRSNLKSRWFGNYG